MRATLCDLILCACATVTAPAAAPTNSATCPCPAAWLQKTLPATAVLVPVDRQGKKITGAGAGFLISDDGILVTARHVCQAGAGLVVFTGKGTNGVAGYYGEDRDYDVAVLKLEGNRFPHLPLAAAALPQTNQWVGVITFELRFKPEAHVELLCVTGAVKTVATTWDDIYSEIAVSAPIHPGQSGSPLLDESGAAIGVVTGCNTNDGTGIAVPAHVVRRILAEAEAAGPIPYAKRPRKGTSGHVIQDPTFDAGKRAYWREDWVGAEPLLKQAARNFPDSTLALMFLGCTYLQLDRLKQADDAFARVVKLKPGSAFAWHCYGNTSMRRHRFSKADTAFRRSIQLGLADKSRVVHAWDMIALADAVRRDGKGAGEALANLQRLDPAKADERRGELRRDFPKLALGAD